ncbi:THO2 [Wolffia australiana]
MALQSPAFKYVTEEALKEWRSSNSGFKMKEAVPAPRFLFELCWAAVRGDLPLQKCRVALDSATFAPECSKDDVSSLLADIVAHMGQDYSMPGEYRARLVKTSKWLVESALVPCKLIQERCEEEFLWEADFSKIKAQDLKAKEVRVNTRLLYQQTKFNLLREESEGYAKLVTLLCHRGFLRTVNASTAAVSLIKSLIGHFDLDPNRVFDIVLECFELYPDCNIFYELIPIFPKSHASQILGFKFQYYQRMDVNSPVPFGLYRLTGLLVKADLIELDSIYVHLLPRESEAFELYDAFLAKRIEMVNKIGKINLAATGKDLPDEEKLDFAVDFFAAIDMEAKAVSERAPEIDSNQSLGLLMGFLSVDDWYHAKIIFDSLSPLNPVEHIQICHGLFRIIEGTISPTYSSLRQVRIENCDTLSFGSSDTLESSVLSSQSSSFVDLPRELFQMLTTAGPYLYRDSLLLQKVCRVLKAYFVSARDLVHTSKNEEDKMAPVRLREARQRVEEALGSCLLPSLQLIPANPAVGQEIWEVLCLLPYEIRYRLYGEWEKEDEQFPMLLAARNTAKLEVRRILKRLAKENLKQHGRTVAKLAHGNPVTVIRTIVHQIEAYKDMITPVVDAFKYLTQLEYDILEYVVIERLSQGGRDKLKEDGLNLSDWLQSLALFWGHLCKKYPSMELRGLLDYLINQLKKGSGVELVVLQELVQQMANVLYTENMTEDQLDALAGGDTLRSQSTIFGMTKANKALSKSTNRLRDSLLPKDEPNLAVSLLLLMAQHRSMVVINADAPYIKVVSEQFDRCHGMLLQFVDFLSGAISPSGFAQMIPSLSDLVHQYHLDPEVAFLIYRPIMRLFKSVKRPEICWPLSISSDHESQTSETDPELCGSDVIMDLSASKTVVKWVDILGTARSMLPSRAWNSLSPDLYTTFWGLTLYDLHVPTNRYQSEIVKQHNNLKALEELTDNSSSAITKRKKDKEKTQELLDKLTLELQKHEDHVASVRQRLAREKDTWLSSCLDTLKINMEFLQRCVFPRCTFSMLDAQYCAVFVHTLHSLGTPYFNTVNHIDVLICKTLQPMICCCTEYEAGRLGRFMYETLKMAYRWKNDESVYERECGNMPGFAVYYRFPNSQRVTFSQFVRVHCKWNTRITRLLIQCLESSEYMEIRNALILLTKISSVFPITRKSGVNLEKRVSKIKADEREDLKVLATGVAAALAARKSAWVSEDDFGMGQIDLKPAPQYPKELSGMVKEAATRTKPSEVTSERLEAAGNLKPEMSLQKTTGDDSSKLPGEESLTKLSSVKLPSEVEPRSNTKRSTQATPQKQSRLEPKEESSRPEKPVSRGTAQLPSTVSIPAAPEKLEEKPPATAPSPSTINGGVTKVPAKPPGGAENEPDGAEKPRQASSRHEEQERKRRKSDSEPREIEAAEARPGEKEKLSETSQNEDRSHEKTKDKDLRERSMERTQERGAERGSNKGLPPPPPLPPSFVPHSFSGSRREEEVDRRSTATRHGQRLSPKHAEEKERRRSEEGLSASYDDAKRRREEDLRDRKRDERDSLQMKVEEREREKGGTSKDDAEVSLATKRRKLKRDHLSSLEVGEYAPAGPPPPPLSQRFEGRESGERKGAMALRAAYVEEQPPPRMHPKEAASKITRRETEQAYDREWEDEKRQRAEVKRKHRK